MFLFFRDRSRVHGENLFIRGRRNRVHGGEMLLVVEVGVLVLVLSLFVFLLEDIIHILLLVVLLISTAGSTFWHRI